MRNRAYLYHNDVQRQAEFLVIEAPLTELFVRRASHDLEEAVSGRRGSASYACNGRDSSELGSEIRRWVSVRKFHQRVVREEHDEDISIRGEDVTTMNKLLTSSTTGEATNKHTSSYV